MKKLSTMGVALLAIVLASSCGSSRVYGCAGCNRIMGAIQVDKDKAGHLSFGQVASTRMLCSDMAT